MDPNKLTQKVIEIYNAARSLALDEQQQQLSPLHFAIIMFEDPEGIAKQACLKASNEDSYHSVIRQLRKNLTRLPKVEPPPAEVFMSADMKKAFAAATKLQREKEDSFLGTLQ